MHVAQELLHGFALAGAAGYSRDFGPETTLLASCTTTLIFIFQAPVGCGNNRGSGARNKGSHPQQPLGVAGQDLGLVLVAQRHRFHPLRARRVRHERPVDREQDALDAHFHHAAKERRIGKVAART